MSLSFQSNIESVMWNEYVRLPSMFHELSSDIQKLISVFPDLHGDSFNSMSPAAATACTRLSCPIFFILFFFFQTSLKRMAGAAYLTFILVCGCQKSCVRDRAIEDYSDNGDVYSIIY